VSVKVNHLPQETCFTLPDTYSFITSISYVIQSNNSVLLHFLTSSLFICILFLPSHHSSFNFYFILHFRSRSCWPASHFCNRKLDKSQSVSQSACQNSGRCNDYFLGRRELPNNFTAKTHKLIFSVN
jgi:hypothetical protein